MTINQIFDERILVHQARLKLQEEFGVEFNESLLNKVFKSTVFNTVEGLCEAYIDEQVDEKFMSHICHSTKPFIDMNGDDEDDYYEDDYCNFDLPGIAIY